MRKKMDGRKGRGLGKKKGWERMVVEKKRWENGCRKGDGKEWLWRAERSQMEGGRRVQGGGL